jgi:catechol 2,3-dioxygenase-like lactoylglutathione lyase family enzyme
MAKGVRLIAAVIFVRDLQRSEDFYAPLLELEVEFKEPEGSLLGGTDGGRVMLREQPKAVRVASGIGVQYLIWDVSNPEELDRCENLLKSWGAHVATEVVDGVKLVEGHDPDGLVVLLSYPVAPRAKMTKLPERLYAY